MHMQGTPKTMQQDPKYQNVVEDVLRYLLNRAHQCQKAGLKKQHIILDIGFGFGKTQENNLTLLKNLNLFCNLGYPILVGISRKTMIGEILKKPVNKRLYGSLSAAVYAAMQGARILRVHDVKETVQAIKIIDTLNKL
jgi:dihydropteroate synthase